MNYKFSENEVPFGILQRYGLTQEMVEDLPTASVLLSSPYR